MLSRRAGLSATAGLSCFSDVLEAVFFEAEARMRQKSRARGEAAISHKIRE